LLQNVSLSNDIEVVIGVRASKQSRCALSGYQLMKSEIIIEDKKHDVGKRER
jgi:hypothetical protein